MPIISDAPFYAPLGTSLILQNGSGNPTFTRSTTRTVFDNEGKLITLPSGAAAFEGARIVRNLIGNSFNIVSGLSSLNVNLTPTADPVGGTAAVLFESTSTSNHNLNVNVVIETNLTTSKRTLSFYFQPGSHDWFRFMFYNGSSAQARIWFNAQTKDIGISEGVNGFTLHQSKIYASTDYPGWWRVELTGSSPTNGAGYWQINAQAGNGSISLISGATIVIYGPQMEPVVGQSDPGASEYIPTGELSAPYHGCGVDGVKAFNTNKDGSAIQESRLKGLYMNSAAVTNTLLYCRDFLAGANAGKWIPSTTGSELVANGTFDTDASGWTTFNMTTTVASGQCTMTATGDNGYISRSFATAIGVMYTATCNLVSDAMTGNNFLKIGTATGSSNIVSFNMTSLGVARVSFVASGTTTYISVTGGTGVTGQSIVVDDIGCKKSAVQAALTKTGVDGLANSCSLLTAEAADATILQTITAAAAAGCSGFYVKRSVGTGSIYITRDGGSNWTDITSLINSSTFTLVKIENTSILNPQVGIKIATSGDAVIADYVINHLGTEIASPIFTTNVAVTVNAETLTYQTSGNFSDTAGTIIATVERDNWTNNNGVVVGKAGSGLAIRASNSGVQALDGTNTVNGPAGATATRRKIGLKYSGSSMKTFAGGNFGSPGSYDGSFNLTTIALMPQSNGYIKDVAIWQTELSDADMLSAASEQSDFFAAVTFAASAYANVIHSVSASMPVTFNVEGNANVIHSVSASMPVTFNVEGNLGWLKPTFNVYARYTPPIINVYY